MIQYFNPGETKSLYDFTTSFRNLLEKCNYENKEIVLICIGSDRATGDCLGPIIGHKLRIHERRFRQKGFHVYGTLEKPIHAKNLETMVTFIQLYHPDALVIAIDASLGTAAHVGYVTLGEGSLCPGIGVDKNLPSVGDIFITGIVNLSGFGGQMLLQTTHLNLVMQLADFISLGIYRCLWESKFRPALQRAE
ncbi:MAG: spore protease YyaC [Lachnospiraceae bacterium]|nr:spore protease YyaC [Lachnospiraceae bacterium]